MLESPGASFRVHVERLGPLPIVNHFLERLELEPLIERFAPAGSAGLKLPYAKALGVLLRSILLEREPIYRQHETVRTFAPWAFGLKPDEVESLHDDQIGRALERLFSADRASLLTAVVVAAGKEFAVRFDELHNDSTSIRFCGQYRRARGRSIRGRRGPWITYGHSKDRRRDLKQLMVNLTASADGGVPVQFRSDDGNRNDATTHRENWDTIREVTGRPDFLYVADSKLCTRENMDYIDQKGGRFVTVLPRARSEDAEFREWIQTHEPDWEKVWDRPNPRRKNGPRDRWWVHRYRLPSRESWPVTWVWSSLLGLHQEHSRRERIARAEQDLGDLREKLRGKRPRLKSVFKVELRVEEILKRSHVEKYVCVHVFEDAEAKFRQEHPGRPGPDTRYRKLVRRRIDLLWEMDETAIAYDRKSDGMYPLLTNDRAMTPAQVLEAHKRQPMVEKRFEQTKSVYEIAPVFLKNEDRVEALFFLYFFALLIQALIERELRRAMAQAKIASLPLYPEGRECKRPTTDQVFRLFSLLERITILKDDQVVHVAHPELTPLQSEVLELLGLPERIYRRLS